LFKTLFSVRMAVALQTGRAQEELEKDGTPAHVF
jgi:hypothetical protein